MKDLISNIRNFFWKLRRSCRWFKRMWNNHDFDDGYLIEVIVWKLKDMLYQLDVVDSWFVDLRHQEHYKDNGYDGDMLKSMEECIEIGERLIADDYIVYPDEVKNWLSEHNINEKMPENIIELMAKCYHESEWRKSEDNERFFNLIKKYHWGWWS